MRLLPNRRGAPTLSDDGALAKTRTIRLTDRDWLDFIHLGGARWLRDQLAQARRSKDGHQIDVLET